MPSYDLSGSTYSETDSANNSASPAGMPEGMAPSGVNDAWRAGMGATKRAYDRDHPGTWCTVAGSANAITLAYTFGPTAYVQGETFAFKATATNTSATTINVSGLGIKNVFKKTASGVVACVGGEIQSGDLVLLQYDGTQFQIVGAIAVKRPTRTVLTATSGTYPTPSGCTAIYLRAVGAGGGGAGSASGTSAGGGGGNGGNTTFGTMTALGGGGAGTLGNGGTGSSSSGGDAAFTGQNGLAGYILVSGAQAPGGAGGSTPFGGAGAGHINDVGSAAQPSTGSGGSGAGAAGFATTGGGGGAGGYQEKRIAAPAASYAYTVGTGGTAGTAGSGGNVGGAGADGVIIVDEFYD